jgi:hypothetical protein
MDRRAKIVAAAKALNDQRYCAGLGLVKRRWISCAKGDVLMAGLYPRHAGERPAAYNHIEADDTTPLEALRIKALMASCECHKSLSMTQLMDLMYD